MTADPWLEEIIRRNDTELKMTDKQIKIIEAAAEIFSSKGYAAASTSEIAQKAGVAEGTIFRHYKTKKDLLLSIVGPLMTKLIAPMFLRDFIKQLRPEHEHFEDFLRAVIVNRLEFARENLPVIKIMLQEIPFQPELKAQFIDGVASKVLEHFKTVVQHYQQQGKIIKIPPISAVRLAVSAIIGFILMRVLLAPEHDWNDEQEIELTVDFIMHGLTPRTKES